MKQQLVNKVPEQILCGSYPVMQRVGDVFLSVFHHCDYVLPSEVGLSIYNSTELTNGFLESNCTAPCPGLEIHILTVLNHRIIPILVIALFTVRFALRRLLRLKHKILHSGRVRSEQTKSSTNQQKRKGEQLEGSKIWPNMHKAMGRFLNLTHLFMFPIADMITGSHGAPHPDYIVPQNVSGRCLYGVPTQSETVTLKHSYYYTSALLHCFSYWCLISAQALGAQFVHWRTNSVQRILVNNRKSSTVRKAMQVKHIVIACLVIVMLFSIQFQVREYSLKNDECVPLLFQRAWQVCHVILSVFMFVGVMQSFRLRKRLLRRAVSARSKAHSVIYRRQIKNTLMVLVGVSSIFVTMFPHTSVVMQRISYTVTLLSMLLRMATIAVLKRMENGPIVKNDIGIKSLASGVHPLSGVLMRTVGTTNAGIVSSVESSCGGLSEC